MLCSSLTVLAVMGLMQVVGPVPPAPASKRILIIGASVITSVENGVAEVFPDATIVIENNRVSEVGPRTAFSLRENDIAVTARDRFAIAAPILSSHDGQWLRGTSLLEAAVSGIGFLAMPKTQLDTPNGRCAIARAVGKEFPAALPIESKQGAISLSAVDPDRKDVGLQIRLAEVVAARLQDGATPLQVLEDFSVTAARSAGRDDLGSIQKGSIASILITNGDPRTSIATLFDPHAFVMGDRVMRRAEIETVRDTLRRSATQRETAATLEPPGENGRVHRYLVSVGGQIFGGAALRVGAKGVSFVTKQGAPRNDSIHGTLQHEGIVGHVEYAGPPESFSFRAKAVEGGLSIKLNIEDNDPVQAASAGSSAPPLMELAADIAIRAAALSKGTLEFDAQELIYGNGPIGLGPRKLRFTPVPPESCPPCFEERGDVWQLEVFDLEVEAPEARFYVLIAMRDGAPSRIRIDTPYGASWYDVMDSSLTLD
jgi:hypothetical protein